MAPYIVFPCMAALIVAILLGFWAVAEILHWRGRARLAESRLAQFKRIVDEAYAVEVERRERQEMKGTLWPC